MRKAFAWGAAASSLLILIYVLVVSALSGWDFAKFQISQYWYFLAILAAGLGAQVGLYRLMRDCGKGGSGAVVVSGATSTASMLACCSHYLANLLPFWLAGGAAAALGNYQVEFFFLGIAINVIGFVYLLDKYRKMKNTHAGIQN